MNSNNKHKRAVVMAVHHRFMKHHQQQRKLLLLLLLLTSLLFLSTLSSSFTAFLSSSSSVLFVNAITTAATTATTKKSKPKTQQQQQQQKRILQDDDDDDQENKEEERRDDSSSSSSSFRIIDATENFIQSTESLYDHEIILEDNLSFHWNDISASAEEKLEGRLIHKCDTSDQAPAWLGFGVYHSNHNYTKLPTSNFMVGSTALIGLPTQADTSIPILHYHLQNKYVDQIIQVNDDNSFDEAYIVQHDKDTGEVITDLSFHKSLSSTSTTTSSSSMRLRRDGTNVFIWAVGGPGVPGRLSKHSLKGVIYLDFHAVQQKVEGVTTATTTTTTTPEEGGGEGGDDNDSSISTTSGGGPEVNTSPIISGKCGLSSLSSSSNNLLLDGIEEDGNTAGRISLTPTLTFLWILIEGNEKIRLALEYTGREAWLGLATTPNGHMVGSSAVIGVPDGRGNGNDDNDNDNNMPKAYLLNDQDISGLEHNEDIKLESASISSVPSETDPSSFTTTLIYTKLMNDPNDPVPISFGGGSLTTFLFAVGNDVELAYHEHRGSFRIDLEECQKNVNSNSNKNDVGPVWTHHGLFAMHGLFAVLAWALSTPFAITVAWFRTLLPSAWIYVHVFANVSTFLLTFFTFVFGLIGVAKEDEADHFTHLHHWVGMLLFFLCTFQVINGFLRPPVERKDSISRPMVQQDTFLGIPLPRTPRQTWEAMHRLSGLCALLMSIYQIQSGLKLYAQRFQTTNLVMVYWIYILIFVVSLIGLKLWVVVEEGKARQGVMEAVSTQEPIGLGDEERTTTAAGPPKPTPQLAPLPPEFSAVLT